MTIHAEVKLTRRPFRFLEEHRAYRTTAVTTVALIAAVVLTGVVLWAAGANPIDAYGGILSGALGSRYALGLTLMAATPLALTGIAAAVPFSARIWNIGGDGQLYAGAIASVLFGLTFTTLQPVLLTILCILAALVAGAAWGMIAGVLKVLFGANEVIVTLMLNFIALSAADYVITGPWAQGVSPQTKNIPNGVNLPGIPGGTGANLGVVMAMVATGMALVLMRNSALGLSIRATGFNPKAARLAGFSIVRITVMVFGIGGAFAGLAGAIEVVGVHHALIPDISANYGFIGIAVALLARLRPQWIIPSALFFAILTVGGNNLTATSGISTSTSLIIEALFVILLMLFRVIRVEQTEG